MIHVTFIFKKNTGIYVNELFAQKLAPNTEAVSHTEEGSMQPEDSGFLSPAETGVAQFPLRLETSHRNLKLFWTGSSQSSPP